MLIYPWRVRSPRFGGGKSWWHLLSVELMGDRRRVRVPRATTCFAFPPFAVFLRETGVEAAGGTNLRSLAGSLEGCWEMGRGKMAATLPLGVAAAPGGLIHPQRWEGWCGSWRKGCYPWGVIDPSPAFSPVALRYSFAWRVSERRGGYRVPCWAGPLSGLGVLRLGE